MPNSIPYPNMRQIGQAATDGVPVARLLWMALAQLASHPDYQDKTPEEIITRLVEICNEVYSTN